MALRLICILLSATAVQCSGVDSPMKKLGEGSVQARGALLTCRSTNGYDNTTGTYSFVYKGSTYIYSGTSEAVCDNEFEDYNLLTLGFVGVSYVYAQHVSEYARTMAFNSRSDMPGCMNVSGAEEVRDVSTCSSRGLQPS